MLYLAFEIIWPRFMSPEGPKVKSHMTTRVPIGTFLYVVNTFLSCFDSHFCRNLSICWKCSNCQKNFQKNFFLVRKFFFCWKLSETQKKLVSGKIFDKRGRWSKFGQATRAKNNRVLATHRPNIHAKFEDDRSSRSKVRA